MKKVLVWLTAGIFSAVLVGCLVSSDKYNRLEAEHRLLKDRFDECNKKLLLAEKEKADLQAKEQQSRATYEQLMNQLKKEVAEGQVTISQYEDRLTVNVAEKIFFDSGRAALKPGGKEMLKKVGSVLKGLTDKMVRVEGHTDNVPIAKPLRTTYPTNWELSAARATTVVRFLQESTGVPPDMLVAAAFGQYHPLAPNDTAANKQKNRRIEIVLQKKDVLKRMEAPLVSEPKAAPAKTEIPAPPAPKETTVKPEPPATPTKKGTPTKTEAPSTPAPKGAPTK